MINLLRMLASFDSSIFRLSSFLRLNKFLALQRSAAISNCHANGVIDSAAAKFIDNANGDATNVVVNIYLRYGTFLHSLWHPASAINKLKFR